MTNMNTWVHPKTNETRIYLNLPLGFKGIKVFAHEIDGGVYEVRGWYDDASQIPKEHQNAGKCWAINMFMQNLENVKAPSECVEKWKPLLKFVESSALEAKAQTAPS